MKEGRNVRQKKCGHLSDSGLPSERERHVGTLQPVHLMPPSRYVALRYGLADDYDRLDRLNRSGPESAYDEG